jgi:SAM-dependent methyltransferase
MDTNENKPKTAPDTDIHKVVRAAYAGRVTQKGCCSGADNRCAAPSANIERAAEKMGYSPAEIGSVPDESNLGLGCGAPLKAASIRTGDTVLDLGSGAGFDAFLAARAVGTSGKVIGVDMTPEMVAKARSNAERHKSSDEDMPSVEFREGKIEALPVESNCIDVIISNCVINLSPDKPACFREAYRVLKPGGRIAVSDIVLTKPLPASVQKSLAAYVGCIAGASLLPDYLDAMRAAGFVRVAASTTLAFDVLACDDPIVMAAVEGLDLETVKDTIVSATVVAYKD